MPRGNARLRPRTAAPLLVAAAALALSVTAGAASATPADTSAESLEQLLSFGPGLSSTEVLVASTAEEVQGTLVQTIQTSAYSPSSPDPSAIVYIGETDRFLIGDSEVDEMPLYQGSNLFTATRAGSGAGTGTTLAFSREPTGIGYNPADRTLYVADDDADRVSVVRPGVDGVHGTPDDVWTRFSVGVHGITDAEGVAYDTTNGHLFICDGVGTEIYELDPVNGVFGDAGDVVTHFDIGAAGPRDCEGVAFDPVRDTLLAVDPATKRIYEFTKAGALTRTIALAAITTVKPLIADVALAPSSDPSDHPSQMNFWIVDRHVDNNTDPSENDGLLYEVSVPSGTTPPPDTTPPTVAVSAPSSGATVLGTVTVTASASDNDAVASVQFRVDGNPIATDSSGADGWSVPWNTTTAADGSHDLTAVAVDRSNNSATSAGVQVTVDNPSTLTLSVPLRVGSDDADEVQNGAVANTKGDVELGSDLGVPTTIGLRFSNVAIQKGATIVNASVQFTTDEVSKNASSLVFRAQAADNALAFTTAAFGISSRPRTTASATWAAPEWLVFGEAGPRQRTVNLSAVVQEVVNRAGWASGNALALIVTGTGRRTAESFEGGSPAVLHLEYTLTADSQAPSVALTAPTAGATVTGSVNLTASASDNVGVASVEFRVGGNTIATDTNGADGWSVSWDSTSVANGNHSLTAVARDPSGNSTTSTAVGVLVSNAPPPATVTLTVPLRAGTDDADEVQNGAVANTKGDVELGSDLGVPTTIGLRFSNLAVPTGATIISASVQFTTDEKSKNPSSLVFRAQAADNALAFTTTAFGISSRPRTTASATWAAPEWLVFGEAGPRQRTVNLSAVVQEVVNRTGWASGNALALIVTGTGRRTAEAFEGGSPAVLHLEYATP